MVHENQQHQQGPPEYPRPTSTSTTHRVKDPGPEPYLQLHRTSRDPQTMYHRKDAERKRSKQCTHPTGLQAKPHPPPPWSKCVQAHQTKALREPSVPSSRNRQDYQQQHSCDGQQQGQHQSKVVRSTSGSRGSQTIHLQIEFLQAGFRLPRRTKEWKPSLAKFHINPSRILPSLPSSPPPPDPPGVRPGGH